MFILNVILFCGKKFVFDVNVDWLVEVRVYYFIFNREREDFDLFFVDFKGVFRGKGEYVLGEVFLRLYEDFVVIFIIGIGNVFLIMIVKEVFVLVSGIGKYFGELIVVFLVFLLVVVIVFEWCFG